MKTTLLLLALFAFNCAAQIPVPAIEPPPPLVAAPTAPIDANMQGTPAANPASSPCNTGMTIVNASLWMQSSAEYRANALQVYGVARRQLDAALADKTWNAIAGAAPAPAMPAAVVLDLDETAIDNTRYEARVIRKGTTYDLDEWKKYSKESSAAATPGATEFLRYAQSRGVKPFYISNRSSDEEPAMLENLRRLGYPLDPNEDTILFRGERKEWQTGDKTARREYVASKYRVLLVFGDDLNDFVSALGKTRDERAALVTDNAAEWGTKWMILPNPIYGSWEKAIVGNSTNCEQTQKKLDALKP